MRANAQRDGRPAEYRWRPLFNAAKFGWRPLLECRAVTQSRGETRWNLQGCPKLVNRSQPLVGGSSPYCQDMCRRYWWSIIFASVSPVCSKKFDSIRTKLTQELHFEVYPNGDSGNGTAAAAQCSPGYSQCRCWCHSPTASTITVWFRLILHASLNSLYTTFNWQLTSLSTSK